MMKNQMERIDYFELVRISLVLWTVSKNVMRSTMYRYFWIVFCFLWACQTGDEQGAGREEDVPSADTTELNTAKDTLKRRENTIQTMEENFKTDFDTLAQRLEEEGLVRLKDVDPTMIVDLRYSTPNNFTGMDVYGPFEEAYMQPEPARMLVRANEYLKKTHPDHTLYIYDAVRPRSVQRILWDTLDMPVEQKNNYVADPDLGSIHNFGAAVDLTIAGPDGQPIDMGTDFDYFGELAYPIHEERMLQEERLAREQVANRRLLRDVMTRAGFTTINSEWWHFNAMSRDEAAARYGIVE
jgi:D-alanyl-D-alanine dipeptidase